MYFPQNVKNDVYCYVHYKLSDMFRPWYSVFFRSWKFSIIRKEEIKFEICNEII